MDEIINIPDQLQALLTQYEFNVDTLARYLDLSASQLQRLAQGNIDSLPEDSADRFSVFCKIGFLYGSAAEDKDLKLSAFLQTLISYHRLSKKTLARMSGVELRDMERLLSNPPQAVSAEIKYQVAVTVMALRFFLKDCEPEPS